MLRVVTYGVDSIVGFGIQAGEGDGCRLIALDSFAGKVAIEELLGGRTLIADADHEAYGIGIGGEGCFYEAVCQAVDLNGHAGGIVGGMNIQSRYIVDTAGILCSHEHAVIGHVLEVVELERHGRVGSDLHTVLHNEFAGGHIIHFGGTVIGSFLGGRCGYRDFGSFGGSRYQLESNGCCRFGSRSQIIVIAGDESCCHAER